MGTKSGQNKINPKSTNITQRALVNITGQKIGTQKLISTWLALAGGGTEDPGFDQETLKRGMVNLWYAQCNSIAKKIDPSKEPCPTALL